MKSKSGGKAWGFLKRNLFGLQWETLPGAGEAMSILLDTLVQGALKMGLELSQEQVGLFKEYYGFLAEANKSINLTSILDEKDVCRKAFFRFIELF